MARQASKNALDSAYKRKTEETGDRFWDWGIYGEPGSFKTLAIKNVIESGIFDLDRVLYVDAERGDATLGDLDVRVLHVKRVQVDMKLNNAWAALQRILNGLENLAKTEEVYPYDLVVFEGTSLMALWCEEQVVVENQKSRSEMATLPDFRLIKSRMVQEFFRIKWLPACKIVTARMRTDYDTDVAEIAPGRLIETKKARKFPQFNPSLAGEFLAIWDVVTRFEYALGEKGRGGGKLEVHAAPTVSSIAKDRYGIFKGFSTDPDIADIIRRLDAATGRRNKAPVVSE